MQRLIRPKQNERGQSMIELALVVTVVMVLLAGTIDMGRGFFTWLAMRDSAQEGATYGSIVPPSANVTCNAATPSPEPKICLRVWDNLEQVVNSPKNTMVVNVDVDGPSCSGTTITVDVTYPNFPLTMPFLGAILGSDTIPIHATINDTILSPMCP